MDSLFCVENLSFAYSRRKKVLQSLFLDVPAGQVIGVLGRNGSGKSTLFRCLTTVKEPECNFRFHGAYLAPDQRARHIAFLSQVSFLPGDLRVRDILAMIRSRRPEMRDPALDSLADSRVAELSGGERRYLEFLLVMSLGKPLTILDEPFAQLDPSRQTSVCQILSRTPPDRSVLLSDHLHHTVMGVCDQVLVLRSGVLFPARNEADLARLGYV